MKRLDIARRRLTMDADFEIAAEGNALRVDARFFGLPKESLGARVGTGVRLSPLSGGIGVEGGELEGWAKGSTTSSSRKDSGPSKMTLWQRSSPSPFLTVSGVTSVSRSVTGMVYDKCEGKNSPVVGLSGVSRGE